MAKKLIERARNAHLADLMKLKTLWLILVFTILLLATAKEHRAIGHTLLSTIPSGYIANTQVQIQQPEKWWVAVSIPVDVLPTISDAETLSQQISGSQEILNWNPPLQSFDSWIPDSNFPPPGGYGVNFPVQLGEVYFVLVDSSATTVLNLQGTVPAQNAYQFELLGDSNKCLWNPITIPFELVIDPNAEGLAATFDIGHVHQVAYWSSLDQAFIFWTPSSEPSPPEGRGTNFEVQPGNPYFVCLEMSSIWP